MSSQPNFLDFNESDPFTSTASEVPGTTRHHSISNNNSSNNNNEQTESDIHKSSLAVQDKESVETKAEVTVSSSASSTSSGPPRVPQIPMIHVDLRIVNMGLDIKFEDDPFHLTLNGIMNSDDLVSEIQIINRELESCRATSLDHALLVMGTMMLPLIPFAIRQKAAKKKRRKIMDMCVRNFNNRHPDLWMRWQTRPEKQLLIMRKSDADKLMNM